MGRLLDHQRLKHHIPLLHPKDAVVWQAERLPGKTIGDPKQPYFNFR